jgi:DNA polymerase
MREKIAVATVPILFRDFETRSTLELTKVGAWRYATHVSTDVWCFAYAVDDGPIELWIRGDPVPPEYLEAAQNPEWLVAAFSDQFERLIEQHIMAPRYGWPQVPIERHRCLQASALALALPAKLANVAHALQLEQRKDNAGRLTMLKLSRPRKPRADDDPSGLYWHDDPKDLEKLYAYNKQDVASERAVYQRIGFLPSEEQAHWILDARINDRGIYLDRKLLDAALEIAKAAQREINDELRNITGGELNTINQPKLKQWLATHGCEVTDLQKKTLQKALTRSKLLPDARRAMELRLDGAHAATSKLRTMRDWQAEDGRVRGCFRYHGASPGRFTSLGIQIQNMKRPVVKDLAAAIEAVSTGDLAYLRARFPQPMSVVGDITRALVCARPGYRFIAADYSGIESRVTAWASGQQSKLEQWATFDRTGNPEDEPYFITGHRIFGLAKELARDPGKTGDLAYGYMGSIGAWRKLAPPGDTSTDDEIQRRKQDWRRAHPQTERFWYALDRAAKTAVRHPGKIVPCRGVAFRFYDCFLRMRLPNGRKIAYPFPRLKTNSRGDSAVVFMDNLQGRWVECRHGQGAYGGTWTENAVQAIARDLFIEAMQRLDAAGYSIVLHAHDEVVAEVPIDFGCAEEFQQIFTALPNWATGLPLAAKVRVGERFCKIPAPGATAEIVGDLPTSVIAADVDDEEDEQDAEEIEDVENVEDTDENEDVESDIARPSTQADIDEINAGLAQWGIEPIIRGAPAGHVVENPGRGVDPEEGRFGISEPKAAAGEAPEAPADDPTDQGPKLNGQGADAARVYTSQSHGSGGPKQGGLIASWVYVHPDQPKYLKVDKHVAANGERRFYQHHWNNGRWVYGVKGTYAERKIPYRLPELLAAPPTEPVWICEGEKDADSLAALGLVATTNPGGAKVFQPELAEHFKNKQTAYIPEDNDDAGREHTRKILAVLTGVVPNIAVVQFPDVPEKGDVSDWLELGGTKKLLLARAAQALKNGAA